MKWYRIIYHSIQYIISDNPIYWWEVEHYYYMKRFRDE